LGGIPKTAASLLAKRNYSKDNDLRESLGENYKTGALPLSYAGLISCQVMTSRGQWLFMKGCPKSRGPPDFASGVLALGEGLSHSFCSPATNGINAKRQQTPPATTLFHSKDRRGCFFFFFFFVSSVHRRRALLVRPPIHL
jgi:hypothetical protein